MLRDYLKIAWENITMRKMRTSLTALGVIISVAAIILLVVLGNGLQLAITQEFEKMGTNRITLVGKSPGDPAFQTTTLITQDDADALESLPYFEYINPIATIPSAEIIYHNTKAYGFVLAMPTENFAKRFGDYDFDVLEGRLLNKHDTMNVLVGYKIWDDFFERKLHVNNKILINGIAFRVVGIMEKIGNDRDDKSIIMNLDTFRQVFNKPKQLNYIDAQVKPLYDPAYVAEKVTHYLKRKRGDENFQVFTAKQILKFLTTILSGITFVLSAIAFISLVVGAIGIMNSMFTNVLERTNEIGIMKSIGAQNKDILLLFLLESGIIGLVGGIIGIFIGQSGAYLIGGLINKAGFLPITIVLNWQLLVGALFFAIFIGMLAGIFPSYRAAKLPPVEALRYD